MNLNKINQVTQGKFSSAQDGSFSELELSKVYANPYQPRKSFENIEELAESIKTNGLIQPIAVVKSDKGYMIISGERRYRASLHAELKTIKAHIIKADNKKIQELSLVENIQREDLTDFEKAKFINTLWASDNYKTKKELAKAIGKSQSYLSKVFNAVKLSDEVVKEIEATKADIGLELLQELSSIKDEDTQLELFKSGATREKIRAAKSETKDKKVSLAKKFKRVMTLDRSDSEGVTDYLSGLPLNKNYKITIEEI